MSERRLGPYVLHRQLGSGGMGQVWEASPVAGGPPVALKWLHGDAPRGRFFEEMRVGRGLQHPNIVRIVDAGEHDGQPWLAMELLKGATLATLRNFRPEPWPPGLVLELARQLLAALGALHDAGVVHRDVKPSNVFVTRDGSLRLIDLGVALWANEDRTSTRSGTMVGSVRYASPEQARGEPVDARSDLYSAALVLFELLSGRRLYDQPTDVGVLSALMFQPPPDLSELCPSLPFSVGEAVSRALAKDPGVRTQTTVELAQALSSGLELRAWGAADVAAWLAAFPLDFEGPQTKDVRPAVPEVQPEAATGSSARSRPVRWQGKGMAAAAGAVGALAVAALGFWAPGNASRSGTDSRRPVSPSAAVGSTVPSPGSDSPGAATTATGTGSSAPTLSSVRAPDAATGSGAARLQSSDPGSGAARAHGGAMGTDGSDRATGSPTRSGAPATAAGSGSARSPVVATRSSGPTVGSARTTGSTTGPTGQPAARVPRSPRTKRTTAAAVASSELPGWLTLSVERGWGRVYLNRKLIGETPLFRHPAAAGTHVVEVVAPDGRRRQQEIAVRPGAESRVTVRW